MVKITNRFSISQKYLNLYSTTIHFMKKSEQKHFNEYAALIKEIDKISKKLSGMHSSHLQCKKGCDWCCMDYRIFPLEFDAILNKLKEKEVDFQKEEVKGGACIFLKDHACMIYENRPVICRTHGLPLLYMNDDNEWELSNCELNFTDFDFDGFNAENTFPMDRYNSKLFLLNRNYIQSVKEKPYLETDLIPVKQLAKHLKQKLHE